MLPGGAGAHCLVRITVDDNEIAPVQDKDSSFDRRYLHQRSANTQAQHGIVRISPTLSAGAHTVKVEIATILGVDKFRYDDWTLAAQRIRVT